MLGNEMQLIGGGKLVSYEAVPLWGSEVLCPVGRTPRVRRLVKRAWPPLGTWRTPAPTTERRTCPFYSADR